MFESRRRKAGGKDYSTEYFTVEAITGGDIYFTYDDSSYPVYISKNDGE